MQKREFLKNLGVAALGGYAATAINRSAQPPYSSTPTATESAFERVMRTKTLRCGYYSYAPNFIKDPNTGDYSGIFADLMTQAAHNLGFEIFWVMEGGTDVMVPALQNGHIDLVGSGWWSDAPRSKVMDASNPVFFNALGVYVRKNETRFSGLDDLNSSRAKVAVVDGATASTIANTDFPKAQKHALPPISDLSLLLHEVAHGKADFTISATHEFLAFDKSNPGLLKRLDIKMPIRVFPNVLFVNKGENKLQSMLDATMQELFFAGIVDRTIDRYESFAGSFYRTAKPYQMPLGA